MRGLGAYLAYLAIREAEAASKAPAPVEEVAVPWDEDRAARWRSWGLRRDEGQAQVRDVVVRQRGGWLPRILAGRGQT